MQIGFVGLGNMGRGIAMNLVRTGHDLVVFDVSADACGELVQAGARPADSPRELAALSDVVFTSLPTPAIVENVCWGEDGLAAGLAPGRAWFDLSTNSVHVVRRLHEQLAGQDVSFLDAPSKRRPQRRGQGAPRGLGRRLGRTVHRVQPSARRDRRPEPLRRPDRGRDDLQAGPQHGQHRDQGGAGRGPHAWV